MKNKIVITLALLFCLFSSFVPVNPINGNWTGEIQEAAGRSRVLYLSFYVSNDSLTVTVHSNGMNYDATDGKVKGDSLWFVVVLHDQSVILNSAKYYSDGDSISLNSFVYGVNEHCTLLRVDVKK
jgi:hypothetical protein